MTDRRFVRIASVYSDGSLHEAPYEGSQRFADIFFDVGAFRVMILKDPLADTYVVTNLRDVRIQEIDRLCFGKHVVCSDYEQAEMAARFWS